MQIYHEAEIEKDIEQNMNLKCLRRLEGMKAYYVTKIIQLGSSI